MATITTSRSNQIKSTGDILNKNGKIILLSTLKNHFTSCRMSKLCELIGENKKKEEKNERKEKLETPKWDVTLKAIIISIPKEERYSALKLLKNNFDIQLTAPQIESIKKCLLEDPAFYKLLPFSQKKFLESFLVQPVGNKITPPRVQKIVKDNTNLLNNQKNRSSKQISQKSDVLKNPIQKPLIKSNIKTSTIYKENLFQDFFRKFYSKSKNDQFNLFLQFQRSQPKLLTEYFKSPQNIIELFRSISETSLSCYFKLPIVVSAINRAVFSWDNVISMLKTHDNENVYLFIDYLLARNKLTKTIDIEQLELLLLGNNPEQRLDFFNRLIAKQLIPLEITTFNIKLIDLFPNIEKQSHNVRQQPLLFFRNKGFKHELSLETIEEECDEIKKFKSAVNQSLSRRI